MPKATDDTITYAARIWPQAQPDDFDRDSRRYVARATGIVFDLCHGNVLLGDDPEAADCFFSADGSLWLSRRHDRSEVRTRYMGAVSR